MNEPIKNFILYQLQLSIFYWCAVSAIAFFVFTITPEKFEDPQAKYFVPIAFTCFYALYSNSSDEFEKIGTSKLTGESFVFVIYIIFPVMFLFVVDDGSSKFHVTGNYIIDWMIFWFVFFVFFRLCQILFRRYDR